MKNIITFIKESWRSNDPKAPADVQKYLDGSMSWEDLVKNAQDTWAKDRK